jgi:glycosyltransferase involved in cell wall biosynthesis
MTKYFKMNSKKLQSKLSKQKSNNSTKKSSSSLRKTQSKPKTKSKLLKISIITPSYNQGHFIERTIKSIVTQAGIGKDFELEYIIMDGASTDNTVEIIKRYAKKYKFINWVSEKDKGQSDAINKGISKATGSIVTWLNSDDVYFPNALKTVAQFWKHNPNTQWAFGFCDIIDEHDKEILKNVTKYKNFWLKNYSYTYLLIENAISQPSTFFTKELFNKVAGVDVNNHRVMDYDLWLKMGKLSKPKLIKSYLTHFRRYDTSKSGSMYDKQFMDEYRAIKPFTKNPIIRGLHYINAKKIILAYKFLDWKKSRKKHN